MRAAMLRSWSCSFATCSVSLWSNAGSTSDLLSRRSWVVVVVRFLFVVRVMPGCACPGAG